MGLCKLLRGDGPLTAGACGYTTWNETLENLREAPVNREARHILPVTAEDEDEAESDGETSCMAASRNHGHPQERPIWDAMTGQVLDKDLVATATTKGMDYFLVRHVRLERHRSEAYQATGKPPITVT